MVIEGPLAAWAAPMAERLSELGYVPGSTRNHLSLVAALSRYLERRGLGAGDLTPVVLQRFCSSLRRGGRSSPTPKTFVWLIEFLRDAGVVPPVAPDLPRSEADELVERYRRFMLDERGVMPDTVANYVRALAPFLVEHSERALGDLEAGDVTRFMTGQCRRLSSRGLERLASSLRSFFGFALAEGLITVPLANAVPSAARWSVAGLPQGLTAAQVKALLASCDRAV